MKTHIVTEFRRHTFNATNSTSNPASLTFPLSAVNINMLAVSYVELISASTQTLFPFTQWDFTLTAGFECQEATLFNFLYKQFYSSNTKSRRLAFAFNAVQLHVLAWKSCLEPDCSFLFFFLFLFPSGKVNVFLSESCSSSTGSSSASRLASSTAGHSGFLGFLPKTLLSPIYQYNSSLLCYFNDQSVK